MCVSTCTNYVPKTSDVWLPTYKKKGEGGEEWAEDVMGIERETINLLLYMLQL